MSILQGVVDSIQNHSVDNRYKIVGILDMTLLIDVNDTSIKEGDVINIATKRTILRTECRSYFLDKDGNSVLENGCVPDETIAGVENEGIVIPNRLFLDLNVEPNDPEINTLLTHGEVPLVKPIRVKKDTMNSRSYITEESIVPKISQYDVQTFSKTNLKSMGLRDGDNVVVSEKINGVQINIYYHNGKIQVMQKQLQKKNIGCVAYTIEELENTDRSKLNTFYVAIKDSMLLPLMRKYILASRCQYFQLIGEMYGVTKGFRYGLTKETPSLKLFAMKTYNDDGSTKQQYAVYNIPKIFDPLVVPFFADIFSDDIAEYADGMEEISGNQLHIKEGIVITKIVNTTCGDFTPSIKILNPNYNNKSQKVGCKQDLDI